MTFDAATASILAAIIVGSVSIISTALANRHALKQLDIKWKQDQQLLAYKEKKETQEKEREGQIQKSYFLQNMYGDAIASLTTLLTYDDAIKRSQKEYTLNLGESQKYLSLIVAHHYNKKESTYKIFLDLYNDARDNNGGYEKIKKLRSLIIDFVIQDPRLNFEKREDVN